uniref:G protein-coupled receptor 141 n=1 Tax=Leptobrachium leishanense TaxID=445787 RepID=A0A8C5N2Z4_9ANUR
KPKHIAHPILVTIYAVVFLGGVVGIVIMTFLLCRTNTRSVTITAVINLLAIHSVFLLSIPFRIIYYLHNEWEFGFYSCKIVSATIHLHMYLCFVFYVIMLGIRFLGFFQHKDKIEFYRKLHSVVASSAVWIIMLVIIIPMVILYGTNTEDNGKKCFYFQKELNHSFVRIVNYIIIAVMIFVVIFLLTVQIIIIVKVVKNLPGSVLSHQEFWAQLKSLFFILVMIFSFFPYHLFRIYYLFHVDECFYVNEIFLAITALSCLDLLSFALQTYFHKICQTITCPVRCPCKL